MARLNAWRTSDRSKYYLREIYKDTEVLLRSIIDTFFVLKILLTSKNCFRLTNKSADTILTSQTDAVRSSRDDFKRHRRS